MYWTVLSIQKYDAEFKVYMQDAHCKTQTHICVYIQNAKYKMQNAKYKIQNTKCKIQNTQCTQCAKAGCLIIQNTKYKIAKID